MRSQPCSFAKSLMPSTGDGALTAAMSTSLGMPSSSPPMACFMSSFSRSSAASTSFLYRSGWMTSGGALSYGFASRPSAGGMSETNTTPMTCSLMAGSSSARPLARVNACNAWSDLSNGTRMLVNFMVYRLIVADRMDKV